MQKEEAKTMKAAAIKNSDYLAAGKPYLAPQLKSGQISFQSPRLGWA